MLCYQGWAAGFISAPGLIFLDRHAFSVSMASSAHGFNRKSVAAKKLIKSL
jgi:hypothetical protein